MAAWRIDMEELNASYKFAQAFRQPYEQEWAEIAKYCWTRQQKSWTSGFTGNVSMGHGLSDLSSRSYDEIGAMIPIRQADAFREAIIPKDQYWHDLMPDRTKDTSDLWRDGGSELRQGAAEWLMAAKEALFRQRYAPYSRFEEQMAIVFRYVAIYGTGALLVDYGQSRPDVNKKGMRYVACPLQNVFLSCNELGQITTLFYRTWFTASQFVRRFPNAKHEDVLLREKAGQAGEKAGQAGTNENLFEVVHCCAVRPWWIDGGEDKIDHAVVSLYFTPKVLKAGDGGPGLCARPVWSQQLPYMVPRIGAEAGDHYGVAQFHTVANSFRSSSLITKCLLQQAQRSANQVFMAASSARSSDQVSLQPGTVNYGLVTEDGKSLLHPIPTGQHHIAAEVLREKLATMSEGYGVRPYSDTKRKTATEVVAEQEAAYKTQYVAVVTLQNELIAPLVGVEIWELERRDKLPPRPSELEDVLVLASFDGQGGNPALAQSLMTMLEIATAFGQAGGGPAVLDLFDAEQIMREVSALLDIPPSWLRSRDEVKRIAEERAAHEDLRETAEVGPALAGLAQAGGGR